jgi:hypothetical protein
VSHPALEVGEQTLARGPNFLRRRGVELMTDNLHGERINVAAGDVGTQPGGLN